MIKDLSQSKTVRGIIIGIFIVVIFLMVFQAGVFVGYRKATFSDHLGNNYYRAFNSRGNFAGLPPSDFPGGHGAVGKIVRINLPTIIVTGPDNVEKIVLIKDNTEIKRFRGKVSVTDLKVDDLAIILGTPNDQGQIEAKLIRLLPPLPSSLTATSSAPKIK